MDNKEKINIAFFGTSEFAVGILQQLKTSEEISGGPTSRYLPNLIITTPDKPAGRKLKLTPPPVKVWADENNIPTLQPEKLDDDFINKLKSDDWDLFVVAAYGKIIPQSILDLPKHQTINVHPSLLPKLRGATPIHSAILGDEKETGVSIILLDKQMDHGPIIIQEKFILWKSSISELPTETELEKTLSQLGGKLLGNTIPKWINNEIKTIEQNHNEATFCNKLKSDDGLIDLNDEAELNFKKIQAFNTWPKAHFFQDRKRVIIKKAHLSQGELIIDKVLVEGGQEINYSDLTK
jgi:methionyl-tRNA formyltransferase